MTMGSHLTAPGQVVGRISPLPGRKRAVAVSAINVHRSILRFAEYGFVKQRRFYMKQSKVALVLGVLAVAASVFVPSAQADEWNRKTVITFGSPVEIPGVHLAGWGVLPAGTYVFKILDSLSDRHIVQIFSQDEKTVYATILAIPNYRLQATDKTVVTFRERGAGQPEALRAWFYPGRNWGEEFVYPKAQAIAIAQATKTPVLFTPAELPVEVAEPTKLAEAPIVAELKRAPVMAVQPSGEEVQLAAVVTPPPAQAMTANAASTVATKTEELPATASDLPLIALAGLVALAGGLVVRTATQRIV